MRNFKPKAAGAAGVGEPAAPHDPLLELAGDEFKCSVCERRFRSQQELMMHMASNAEAHECPECGRRMENAFFLRVHRLIHKPLNTTTKKKEPAATSGSVWKKGRQWFSYCAVRSTNEL